MRRLFAAMMGMLCLAASSVHGAEWYSGSSYGRSYIQCVPRVEYQQRYNVYCSPYGCFAAPSYSSRTVYDCRRVTTDRRIRISPIEQRPHIIPGHLLRGY